MLLNLPESWPEKSKVREYLVKRQFLIYEPNKNNMSTSAVLGMLSSYNHTGSIITATLQKEQDSLCDNQINLLKNHIVLYCQLRGLHALVSAVLLSVQEQRLVGWTTNTQLAQHSNLDMQSISYN